MRKADQRTLAIVNPASAAGRTRRRWSKIGAALHKHLGAFDEVSTEHRGHATQLARAAIGDGYRLIVAVGGDGTLGEVACGFFTDKQAVSEHAVLGHIPQGTGKDFGRTIGIESDFEQACERLAHGSTRTIDVGHVEFVDHQGRPAQRVFVNVASFGCGGAVSQRVRKAEKRLTGRLAFTLATFNTLMTYQDQPVTITFDTNYIQALSITNLAVCNARFFGGGMQVAPHALIDDGQFDVTVWSGFRLRDFILKHHMLFDGSHVEDPRTSVRRARHLHATSNQDVLLDVDGENPGRLPASFTILPAALRVKI